MAKEVRYQHEGLRMGQLLVVVLLLSVAAVFILKKWPGLMGGSQEEKEMQITYMPADFRFDVDEDFALAVLSNPRKYKREFDKLIHDLNLSILMHVATRMGLSSTVKSKIPGEYEKQHPYLKSLYYEDFLQFQDSTSALYQTWYDNQFRSATELLFEVASKYTCTLVNGIIAPMVPMKDGTLFGVGKHVDTPCGIAMSEALAPFLKKLQDRAAIQDFGRAEGLLQEKVERVISELATFEIKDKKGITKQMQTKMFGISVSSTQMQISAISVAKLGFRLDKYFKISLNPGSYVVRVVLPAPEILSHEVYPRFDKLDIGWMREVNNADFNKAFNLLREEFRRDIVSGNGFDQSKAHAREILTTMLEPVIKSFDKRYQIKIEFQDETTMSPD